MRRSAILAATIVVMRWSRAFSAQESPQVVRASVPEYPELMWLSGLEGKFVVNLTVSPGGEVLDAVVVESPGQYFDPQISAHARRWRFEPRDGSSVVTLQFTFRLIPQETAVEERGVFFEAPTTIEIAKRRRPPVIDASNPRNRVLYSEKSFLR
jgi:TonB family protein